MCNAIALTKSISNMIVSYTNFVLVFNFLSNFKILPLPTIKTPMSIILSVKETFEGVKEMMLLFTM